MEQINTLQSKILEHKAYLYATDYAVIRNQETGQDVPENVKDMRKFARAEINRLESEIAELEKQEEAESEDVQLWAKGMLCISPQNRENYNKVVQIETELNSNHKRNVEAKQ